MKKALWCLLPLILIGCDGSEPADLSNSATATPVVTVVPSQVSTQVPTQVTTHAPTQVPTQVPTSVLSVFQQYPYSDVRLFSMPNIKRLQFQSLGDLSAKCLQNIGDVQPTCIEYSDAVGEHELRTMLVAKGDGPISQSYDASMRFVSYVGDTQVTETKEYLNGQLVHEHQQVSNDLQVVKQRDLAGELVFSGSNICDVFCQQGTILHQSGMRFSPGAAAVDVTYRLPIDASKSLVESTQSGTCSEAGCPSDNSIQYSGLLSIVCLDGQSCRLNPYTGELTDLNKVPLATLTVTPGVFAGHHGFQIAENEFTKITHAVHSGVKLIDSAKRYEVQWSVLYSGGFKLIQRTLLNAIAIGDVQNAVQASKPSQLGYSVFSRYPFHNLIVNKGFDDTTFEQDRIWPIAEYCKKSALDNLETCTDGAYKLQHDFAHYILVRQNGEFSKLLHDEIVEHYEYGFNQYTHSIRYLLDGQEVASFTSDNNIVSQAQVIDLTGKVILQRGCGWVCQTGNMLLLSEDQYGQGAQAAKLIFEEEILHELGNISSAARGGCEPYGCLTNDRLLETRVVIGVICSDQTVCSLDLRTGDLLDQNEALLGKLTLAPVEQAGIYGYAIAENPWTDIEFFVTAGVTENQGQYVYEWQSFYKAGSTRTDSDYFANQLMRDDTKRAFDKAILLAP